MDSGPIGSVILFRMFQMDSPRTSEGCQICLDEAATVVQSYDFQGDAYSVAEVPKSNRRRLAGKKFDQVDAMEDSFWQGIDACRPASGMCGCSQPTIYKFFEGEEMPL